MVDIELYIPISKKQDAALIKIAEKMGLSSSTGELDLVLILIEKEIERHEDN